MYVWHIDKHDKNYAKCNMSDWEWPMLYVLLICVESKKKWIKKQNSENKQMLARGEMVGKFGKIGEIERKIQAFNYEMHKSHE